MHQGPIIKNIQVLTPPSIEGGFFVAHLAIFNGFDELSFLSEVRVEVIFYERTKFKGVRNNSFTPLGQEVNVDTVGDDKSNTIYSLVVKI